VLGTARRGVLMVAAVGNDGPQAEPRYPAAYAPVIAVTAVQPDAAVYRRAVQGEHVDLAAPGVDVWTARAGTSGGRAQSGTSFAAPFVTATAAMLMARNPGQSQLALTRELYRATRDLGLPGVDPVYGHGLLQAAAVCGARVSASR
jgi:subtilisin family serine protease